MFYLHLRVKWCVVLQLVERLLCLQGGFTNSCTVSLISSADMYWFVRTKSDTTLYPSVDWYKYLLNMVTIALDMMQYVVHEYTKACSMLAQ